MTKHMPGPWIVKLNETGHKAEIKEQPREGTQYSADVYIGASRLAFRGRRSGAKRGMRPVCFPLESEDLRLIRAFSELPKMLELLQEVARVSDNEWWITQEARALLARIEGDIRGAGH